MWWKRLDRAWCHVRHRYKQHWLYVYGCWLLAEQILMARQARVFSTFEKLAAPVILGDQRRERRSQPWLSKRGSDWLFHRRGILAFNGMVSAVMMWPMMFYRADQYAALGEAMRWILAAVVVLGLGAVVARRKGLDRPTAIGCLWCMALAWSWIVILTGVYDPSTLTGWSMWGVAFGLAFGMALMLVSALTLLVTIVMACLPHSMDGEMA